LRSNKGDWRGPKRERVGWSKYRIGQREKLGKVWAIEQLNPSKKEVGGNWKTN